MADIDTIPIHRSVPLEVIEREISRLDGTGNKSVANTRRRLEFVRLRYKGFSVADATDIMNVSLQTGYNWQEIWNSKGLDGLSPGVSTGRRSRMSQEQREQLLDVVDKDKMTTDEARTFIRQEFGIEYTYKQVNVILGKAGLRHAKPYDIDFRRPDDAEEVLKKTSAKRWTR